MKTTKIAITAIATGLMLTFAASAQNAPADGERGKRGKANFSKMLKKADTNGDGALTLQEAQTARLARFNEVDTNNDSGVTFEEMTAHRAAKRAEKAARRAERGGKNGTRQPRGDDGSREDRARAKFAEADTNNDGRISVEEFSSKPIRGFERADANSDGVISSDEIEAIKSRRGGKRGGRKGQRGRQQ